VVRHDPFPFPTMRHILPLALLPLLAASACSSTSNGETHPRVVSADPATREALFSPLRSLEGRWENEDTPGESMGAEFHVSSGGSAVREIMFPGTPHEMTNMYTLDGDSIVMTHYCAGGNQPHMRATALEGGRLDFRSDGVSDLKAPDEAYMGEMTLVLVDEDHIEQHWRAITGDQVDHGTVFRLKRVR
jgi:hypothetical protein